MDKPGDIYHEKQKLQLCAMHMLNNLFQKKETFTKKDMDDICTSLTPGQFLNPHRSMLGFGNYDVNVIMAALQMKDLSTVWFDKRKNVENINLQMVMGLILNVPVDFGIGFIKLPLNRKHWFVIREIDNKYYNLDSKLSAPEMLGTAGDVLNYVKKLMSFEGRELLMVMEPNVEKTGSWVKNSSQSALV